MTLKHVLVLIAAAFAAVLAWRYHDAEWITRWLHEAPKPKPIQFDNGTVRQYLGSASQPETGRRTATLAPGALRKCWNGSEVTYTNVACPRGYKERAVAGSVSVLPGQGTAKPAPAAAAPRSARSTLHDALDLSRDEHLRQKIIERAIQAQARPPAN